MNKPELGVKRDCPECGARFYDLNKEPAHCPKCDNEFVPEALLKPRKPRREDDAPEAGAPAAKPASEVPLDAAEKEQKAPTSKKKPALDGDSDGDGDSDEEDIEGLGDLDIDIDDDDDDTLLEDDEDEDDDMTGIVSGGDDDEA